MDNSSIFLSISADVERVLSTPEALSRLLLSLLEFEPTSPHEREYAMALVYYVFNRRRLQIYRASNVLLPNANGVSHYTGCGPSMDLDAARDYARSVEAVLAGEIGFEAVKAFKRKVGRSLSFNACLRRIRGRNFEF